MSPIPFIFISSISFFFGCVSYYPLDFVVFNMRKCLLETKWHTLAFLEFKNELELLVAFSIG